jgi:hypothetical protein
MVDARVGSAATVVQVSHDAYAAHAEPSLAANPHNPRNLLGAAQLIGAGPTVLGTFASYDGGRSWHDNGPLPLPPGTATGDDVTVAFDAHGTGFVCAMATPRLSSDDRGIFIWRTDDGGRTFQPPVSVVQGQFVDHPWFAAGASVGTSGDLYVAWTARDGLAFSRSLDDGRHFSSPRIIAASPDRAAVPMIAAGPSGAVYATFESSGQGGDTPDDDTPSAHPAAAPVSSQEIEVVSSTNQGRTFGPPIKLGSAPNQFAPTASIRLPTEPCVAVDSRDGTVYVAYAAAIATSGSAIFLRRSRDHGHTWSAATRVSATGGPGATFAFQPQVVVDEAGAVDISYFVLARNRIAVDLARSVTGATGFETRQVLDGRTFDPALGLPGGKHGLWWIGDYQGLAAADGILHPFWNDTASGRLEIVTIAVAAAAPRTR